MWRNVLIVLFGTVHHSEHGPEQQPDVPVASADDITNRFKVCETCLLSHRTTTQNIKAPKTESCEVSALSPDLKPTDHLDKELKLLKTSYLRELDQFDQPDFAVDFLPFSRTFPDFHR